MRRHHEEISLLLPIVLGSGAAVGAFAKAWLASKTAQPAPEDTGDEPSPEPARD